MSDSNPWEIQQILKYIELDRLKHLKINIFRLSGEDQKMFVRQLFKTIKILKNLESLNLEVEVCSETI